MPRKSEWTDIRKKYKIYSTKKINQIKRMFDSTTKFEENVLKDTYFMLIVFLEKNFKNYDELALQLLPE